VSLRVYIVDDEPLAVDRLERLLSSTRRVEILGSSTDPQAALAFLTGHPVDVLFLDIQMPGSTGFELLAKLPAQPVVVFTTAYDQYALKAFEMNSIDYLLKPIDPLHLERALNKIERMCASLLPTPDFRKMFEDAVSSLRRKPEVYPDRIATRIGERICFLDLARVTHFYAEDKLTYAVADGKPHCVDHTLSGLEERLDPKRFLRIHRATLLNLEWVKDVAPAFAGSYVIRLKDAKQTELTVARHRAHEVKARLGF
jgi:two-component system, LytTR family, response regulator